ncbi:type IV pilin N-terminal domain-containing protein, partial [Methanogenium sp. MK-MG]|uniref:type IV pilin N-terminal domain-containing protein n=1 Tax=Methanogenium sp. MK-MG TaxID=2599926 RepID=UPI0020B10D26
MKKKTDYLRQEAVSPVIGVMLMLVVTIIIAAVVSGFAGNMGMDKKTGPCVTLSEPEMEFSTTGTTYKTINIDAMAHEYWIWHDDDFESEQDYAIEHGGISILLEAGDPQGLVFTHTGGDPIDLKDLQMGFSSNDLGIVIDYNSKRGEAGSSYARIPGSDYSS